MVSEGPMRAFIGGFSEVNCTRRIIDGHFVNHDSGSN